MAELLQVVGGGGDDWTMHCGDVGLHRGTEHSEELRLDGKSALSDISCR